MCRLDKLLGNSFEFYDRLDLELDRFKESNYVLIRNDSDPRKLGSTFQLDESNVGVHARSA
jgi:hypothetical protein